MTQIKDIGSSGSTKEQITAAIGVHGMWKTRIRSATQTGMSEWRPDFVTSSHNCDFGKWLDSFPEAARHADYAKVFALHSDFHKEAARVLGMALSGHKENAEKAISIGSDYEKLTVSLTKAMMEWRDKS
ncbi:MAG: CZB domain-containing protein [Gammaproteobacteria bacterium]|nr:CZB domain-containing protein [Gammaproteobacteria bacterium]